MRKTYKLKEFNVSSENPFTLEGLEVKDIYAYKEGNIAASTETGELFELNPLGSVTSKTIDKATFTKVYSKSLPNIKDFSNSALKIYCYVLSVLEINKDAVYIYMQDAMDFTGYKTVNNIYLGVAELIAKGFLARVTNSSEKYWINPNYMFNGKRQKLIK